MMKNYGFLPAAFLAIWCCGCVQPQNAAKQQAEVQKKIFRQAVKYTDFPVARTALYNIIALNPGDSAYVDSLFFFYASSRAFQQAVFLGNELIAKNPGDTTVRELLAISKQALGLMKEALEDYEALFAKTNSPDYLYQIASLQYNLKRVEECNRSVNQLLGMNSAENQKVDIQYGQNQSQQVPVKAAAYNILGVLARDVNQKETAIAAFRKALEVFPDFELAKGNLDALQKGTADKK